MNPKFKVGDRVIIRSTNPTIFTIGLVFKERENSRYWCYSEMLDREDDNFWFTIETSLEYITPLEELL